jgi:hypothetical protein
MKVLASFYGHETHVMDITLLLTPDYPWQGEDKIVLRTAEHTTRYTIGQMSVSEDQTTWTLYDLAIDPTFEQQL